VPAVIEFAQVDEQIARKQRLLHDRSFAVADLFHCVLGAVAGEILIAQVLFSPGILPGFALNQIPLRKRGSVQHV
jgi:hypothetical protein